MNTRSLSVRRFARCVADRMVEYVKCGEPEGTAFRYAYADAEQRVKAAHVRNFSRKAGHVLRREHQGRMPKRKREHE